MQRYCKALFLLCFFCSIRFSPAMVPPQVRWEVETSKLRPQDLEIRRGETVDLVPIFKTYGENFDLSGADLVVMRYWSSDMTNSNYALHGDLLDTTSAKIPWTPLSAGIPSAYQYEIEVRDTAAAVSLVKCFGKLTLIGRALGTETNLVLDTNGIEYVSQIVPSIDIKPSGMGTGIQILTLTPGATNRALQASITYLRTAPLNGSNIIAGTINSNSINPVLDAIYRSGGGSGGGIAEAPIDDQLYARKNAGWQMFEPGSGGSSSTGPLYWVVNGETIGRVDSNGITMLKGSLSLYQEDLTCNVRLYDGSRISPSISPQGHPGTWGFFFKSYLGTYSAFWSQGSNEIGTLNGSGITLTRTNTAFNGTHIGDISQTTGYPEYLFNYWKTNASVTGFSVVNNGRFSVYNSQTQEVFGVKGTNGDVLIRGVLNANQFGLNSGLNSTGNNWSAYGIGAGVNSTGNNWSAYGFGAGVNSIGNNWAAYGVGAGNRIVGSGWISFGLSAGNYSIGDNWNAIGSFSGQYAIWTNSMAVGNYAGRNATGANRLYIDVLASSPGTNYNAESNTMIFGDNGDLYLGRPDKKLTLRALSLAILNCPTSPVNLNTNDVWCSNGVVRIIQ